MLLLMDRPSLGHALLVPELWDPLSSRGWGGAATGLVQQAVAQDAWSKPVGAQHREWRKEVTPGAQQGLTPHPQ